MMEDSGGGGLSYIVLTLRQTRFVPHFPSYIIHHRAAVVHGASAASLQPLDATWGHNKGPQTDTALLN